MNLIGEKLRVGQVLDSDERIVDANVVEFYVDTFRDHHPFYDPRASTPFDGPIAPPLLYHSEVYRHLERWYLKNLVGNLHAQQEWFLFEPLRLGMRLRTRCTLIDRYQKRGRDYLVNEADFMDENGTLLVRGRTHQSFLLEDATAGAHVVDRATAAKKKRRPIGEGDGPELDRLEFKIDESTCRRFSGPSKNYHTDREAAQKWGFPDIVVQGMLSTCLVSQLMGQHFSEGWFAGGRMNMKFVNVLWCGETVCVRAKLQREVSEGSDLRREFEVWVEKEDEARTPVIVGTASALV